jgi:HEAT repeat protein
LIQALEDEEDRVRWKAAESLGDLNDTRAVGPLIQALEDEDVDVREAAVDALGKLNDTSALSNS